MKLVRSDLFGFGIRSELWGWINDPKFRQNLFFISCDLNFTGVSQSVTRVLLLLEFLCYQHWRVHIFTEIYFPNIAHPVQILSWIPLLTFQPFKSDLLGQLAWENLQLPINWNCWGFQCLTRIITFTNCTPLEVLRLNHYHYYFLMSSLTTQWIAQSLWKQ